MSKNDEPIDNDRRNLEIKNKQLTKKIVDLEKNLKENESLKEQLKKENQIIEEKNKQIQKLNESLEDIKKKVKEGNLINDYLKLKNENEKLKKDMLILNQGNNQNNNKLYLDLSDELLKEKNKNIDLENQIERIKKEKIEDFETYKKNDYNEKYIGKKLEEFYDVVINIKSIYSLLTPEGWPIKWNNKRKEIFNKIKDKELFKIGVLGNGNIGKSFLLSRLLKDPIPSGYSVITEGLSIKYNDEIGYTILDSAGLQTPLINERVKENDENEHNLDLKKNLRESYLEKDFKEYENLYKDKTQTENFIQNLILYLSDMLLIVVGKITFNEQRLINKIKKEIELGIRDEGRKKQIFIIHNLSNFLTKAQVEEHIKNTLKKSASFKLYEKKDINYQMKFKKEIYFFVENENEFQTYHLIMAREGTEAGDFYNEYTYDFLKEKFNNFTQRHHLSIIDEVKDRFVEWSNDLLENKIEKDDIEIIKEGDLEKCYVYKPKEGENKKIIPKACISDELGFSIYRSNGYEPPYNYFIEENKCLILNLEIPGNVEIEECYASIDTKELIVNGTKKFENEDIKPLKNTRKFGKFSLHIPYGNQIKIGDEVPEDYEESLKGKMNGIYIFKFRLAKRRVNIKEK